MFPSILNWHIIDQSGNGINLKSYHQKRFVDLAEVGMFPLALVIPHLYQYANRFEFFQRHTDVANFASVNAQPCRITESSNGMS